MKTDDETAPVEASRPAGTKVRVIEAAGLSAGYSFLIARKIELAIGLGAQYHAVHIPRGVGAPSFGGLAPQLDLNVGYAF